MSRSSIRIAGTGSYLPARRVPTTAMTCDCSEIDPAWVERKLGILSRHVAAAGETTSDLATLAAWAALGNAGLDPDGLDLLIVATATPDQRAPSTACIVQRKLGLGPLPAFDVGAVCSGFLFALVTAAQFIQTGFATRALVIGADTFSTLTDWTRRDAVFFGDGAGAVVVERSPEPGPSFSADIVGLGRRLDAFTVPRGAASFRMDAAAVAEGALEGVPPSVARALARAEVGRADIDVVVPHQPSLNLLRRLAVRLDIPFERFRTSLEQCGNTAAATIPITLDQAHRDGGLQTGRNILFLAAGAGMTAGGCRVPLALKSHPLT